MTDLPKLDLTHAVAHASTRGDRLRVTTGLIEREWQWTGFGFATCRLTAVSSKCSWECDPELCDWQLPDAREPGQAELKELTAAVGDDDGFTSEHVCVKAHLVYPEANLELMYSIWVYPGAPGLRTQLAVRLAKDTERGSNTRQGGWLDARVDRVPAGGAASRRRFFGYYNDTQNRNNTHLDILKEEVIDHPLNGREWCEWASVGCVEHVAGGFALVKESHKCVNQRGHATGGFVCEEGGDLACTGWGVTPAELSADRFANAWATWCVAWNGGDLEREMALKTFDRCRYPIDPARDIYIQANTWGSTDNGCDARRAATEKRVLEEIDSCADLGIDILQIDDGWQVPPGNASWDPGENGWHPHPESYPAGWQAVRERAEARGVRLGLWAAAVPVSLEELQANYKQGRFVQFKLDFAHLRTRREIDDLMQKVRDFILSTGQRVRVNWDVTENSPRYGYYFAREYGCIYLENRKPVRPPPVVVYRPHTVLRDLWQVARYLNLHRFQCSIQNVDRVDRKCSDAHLHSHAYTVAVALMGIPLFFQETKYYSTEARAEINRLLSLYKQHRERIYAGIVHPIGAKPDNASWTGFQCHVHGQGQGYLMIFRERCNAAVEQHMALGWVGERTVEITDLVHGHTFSRAVGPDGQMQFRLEKAPAFLFLHYTVKD